MRKISTENGDFIVKDGFDCDGNSPFSFYDLYFDDGDGNLGDYIGELSCNTNVSDDKLRKAIDKKMEEYQW